MDAVCRHAVESGLDAPTQCRLVRLVARKTELDQTSVATLIRNLYPAAPVPADAVVAAVAGLGQAKGKPAPATQNALVRWLTTVYPILGDAGALSRLYGVLFGLLDMISLR